MFSIDAMLNEEAISAAFKRYPGQTPADRDKREQYMLRLEQHIARALVREAMREAGDCTGCGQPFNGAQWCQTCREVERCR